MALQIRRGTNNERLLMNGIANPVPAVGELLYVTDRKKLYIGDGSTTGGTSAGYFGSIAVSGQDTIFSTGSNELLTLVAGDNISITTDENTNAITINAAAQFDEINNGSIRLLQNNIAGLNSNENINIDPSGTGKVVITGALDVSGTITGNVSGNLTGNVTGNVTGSVSGNAGSVTNGVYTNGSYANPSWITSLDGSKISGNISGNAATVTNGVYTTSIGTVTNTMLANSSITIGSNAVALGDSTTTLTGLTSLTSTTLNSTTLNSTTLNSSDVNVTGVFSNQNISVDENRIRTLNSNQSIFLDPAGTGIVNVNASLVTSGMQIYGPGSGGASGDGTILVITQSSSALPLNILKIHNTGSTVTGGVNFGRARGSIGVQTAVQDNDTISQFLFTGYDGTAYHPSSAITAAVAGTVSSGAIPGRLNFSTSDGASGLTVRMTVSANSVTSTVPVKLAVYADTTARDTAITSPTEGMMIFLTAGTKFQGYTGSAWVDLN